MRRVDGANGEDVGFNGLQREFTSEEGKEWWVANLENRRKGGIIE